jgi:hypothetical protein
MDALAVDVLGMAKYESLGAELIYSNTQERQPMDPVVELITDADPDHWWRQRIDYFIECLETLLADCISLGGRRRSVASSMITKLQEYIPRIRELTATN